MALNDIVFQEGEVLNYIVEVGAATSGTPDDILTEAGSSTGLLCNETSHSWVYPAEGDVESGVTYGPTGADYTGDFGVPAVNEVKKDVKYGADSTEFTGTYDPGGGGNPPPVPAVRFGGGLA